MKKLMYCPDGQFRSMEFGDPVVPGEFSALVYSTSLIGNTTPAGSTWVDLAPFAAQFASSLASCWSADTTTGILTYTGTETKDFIVSADLSLTCVTTTVMLEVFLSQNAALLGTTTASRFAQSAMPLIVDGDVVFQTIPLHISRRMTLAENDTIRPLVRAVTTADEFQTKYYQLSVEPAA